MSNYTPKIVVYACNWSTAEVEPKPNVHLINTMCSGRVEPSFIIEAFSRGADGVMIMACPPGDCHYISGNLKTQRMVMLLKTMLPQLGIDPKRLNLVWLSASDSQKVGARVAEFSGTVAVLGPLGDTKEAVAC